MMALSFTANTIASDLTPHTARQLGAHWLASLVPDRWLDRNGAITAMTIAETVGQSPDIAPGDRDWSLLWVLAAELSMTAHEVVEAARRPANAWSVAW
nr:hypothetical protein [Kibdelosporangium sp. MJ126-NF4]